ncbi:GrpB family protein [Legionella spiritensis]|nr:GrpB family protein [Legionella spiritensis]VEG91148.1 glutamate rich protein GrpB [Legionella spiritensis]
MTSQRFIEVVSYNPEWPLLFEKSALPVKEALGDNCREKEL